MNSLIPLDLSALLNLLIAEKDVLESALEASNLTTFSKGIADLRISLASQLTCHSRGFQTASISEVYGEFRKFVLAD